MKRYIFVCVSLLFILPLFLRTSVALGAEGALREFTIGETIRYDILLSGIKIGIQRVELLSEEYFKSSRVYRINGLTRTAGLLRLFVRHDEDWTILTDATSMYPMWVERNISEGGSFSSYSYDIDQANNTVVIHDRVKGETRTVHTRNVVFDRFSLGYFLRSNPRVYASGLTFDFLKKESVDTVFMRDNGLIDVKVPAISFRNAIPAREFKERGGDGISIYTSTDGFDIPLKIAFLLPKPNEKKHTPVELLLKDVYIGSVKMEIPDLFKSLFVQEPQAY